MDIGGVSTVGVLLILILPRLQKYSCHYLSWLEKDTVQYYHPRRRLP